MKTYSDLSGRYSPPIDNSAMGQITRSISSMLTAARFTMGVSDLQPIGEMNKKCTACFVFLLLIDVLDLICDWLFYVDIAVIEKGLVFGPHDPALVKAVLVFTIIGTLDFPAQVYITTQDTLHPEKLPTMERRLNIFNLIILLLEDIPQAIVLLIVSICREDPSSVWSVTKASFVLVTSLIKFVPNIITCSKQFSKLKTIVLVGAVIEFVIAIMVFLFTQIELSETGGLHYPTPTTLVDDRYNDNAYFADVSLFIHDPNFLSGSHLNKSEVNWLRLDYIRQIQKSERLAVRLEYEKIPIINNVYKFRVWQKKGSISPSNPWQAVGCYNISSNSNKVMVIDKKSACDFSPRPSNLYLTFKFIEPETPFKRHILGDIDFNAKYQKSGENRIINLNSSDFSDSTFPKKYTDKDIQGTQFKTPILMHYFRHPAIVLQQRTRDPHDSNNVIVSGPYDGRRATGRLYKNEKDTLKDVKDTWNTGWMKCKTTGHLAPHFESDIQVAL